MANTQLIKGAAQVYASQPGGYQQQEILQKGFAQGQRGCKEGWPWDRAAIPC